MNLVFICTPGNTGSSVLSSVFSEHGFVSASNNNTISLRRPFGNNENSHINLTVKRYIKERGGDPWSPFSGKEFVPDDRWPAIFKEALRANRLHGNVVMKSSTYLWLKEKMPPAQWVFAHRRIDRTVDSMLERLSRSYDITRETVSDLVKEYFAVAKDRCEYTIDMDDFIRGDSQEIPLIMKNCGVEYDKLKAETVTKQKLWRF